MWDDPFNDHPNFNHVHKNFLQIFSKKYLIYFYIRKLHILFCCIINCYKINFEYNKIYKFTVM